MDTDAIRGVLLVALMIAFIGIWAWAWSSKRRSTFEDAARLPLEEDDDDIRTSEHAARSGGKE